MAVKMKINKEKHARCNSCLADRDHSLELFDVGFTPDGKSTTIICLCDKCMNDLFIKSLKATNMVNSRLKSKADIKVKNARNSKALGSSKHLSIAEALKDVKEENED